MAQITAQDIPDRRNESKRPGTPGDDRNERDPVRESAPLAKDDPLAKLDRTIQEFLGGGPAIDPNEPSRRNPPRRPSDEENNRRLIPASKPNEEEEPLLSGNPNDLGARWRRRRTRDDGQESPVLRRGLLGV